MSTSTLRYYKSTVANHSVHRERKIRDMKKRFSVRMSRRQFKQHIQSTLHRLHLT